MSYREVVEADGLAPIVEKVLAMPEHAHLVDLDADIKWLFRTEPKIKAGRYIYGTCYTPKVNGELSDLFDWMLEHLFGAMPDFLVVLDLDTWEEWAGSDKREILVFHELTHAVQAVDKNGAPRFDMDGKPVWAIKGHDVEEFISVVARYGQWSDEIQAFVEAAQGGS